MFYFYSAVLWAEKVGKRYNVHSARRLQNKYLCGNHFIEADFIRAERVDL
jgi:hypothetical protein